MKAPLVMGIENMANKKTYNEWLEAINKDHNALQQSPSAIRYVPKDLRELYAKYIENIDEKQRL